jgi:glycosyltransferase involved in cell wall biosynthesis
MRIALTSQNLDPKIVVSGIATVASTIIKLSKHETFLFEMGYRDDNNNGKGLKWFTKQVAFLVKFPYFLIKNKIQLVHLNVPFDAMGILREYAALVIAKLLRKKVIVHIHGGKYLMLPTNSKFLDFFIQRILNDCDKVIVLSEIENKVVEENFKFKGAISLENAVDTSYFNYNPKGNSNKKPQVLYLARITESKGIDDIIEAVKLLYPEVSFKFVICGAGPDLEHFVSSCEKLMGEDAIYKGVVAGDEKLKIIHESDIFLLPSRHSEGLPMSLLETMSCGLVPVVTDEASMKFVVQPEVNGLRVLKYNGQDIYHQMKNLMQDNEKLKTLSFAASETIKLNYDTRNYVKKLEDIYSELIKENV